MIAQLDRAAASTRRDIFLQSFSQWGLQVIGSSPIHPTKYLMPGYASGSSGQFYKLLKSLIRIQHQVQTKTYNEFKNEKIRTSAKL